MKEIKDHVYLYNTQGSLRSLAVDIDFMKNMSSKLDLNPFNLVTLALFSLECALK